MKNWGKKFPQKASIFAKTGFAYGEMNQYARSAEVRKAIRLGAKDQTMYNLIWPLPTGRWEKKKKRRAIRVRPPR